MLLFSLFALCCIVHEAAKSNPTAQPIDERKNITRFISSSFLYASFLYTSYNPQTLLAGTALSEKG